jgi:hypothetical protein
MKSALVRPSDVLSEVDRWFVACNGERTDGFSYANALGADVEPSLT